MLTEEQKRKIREYMKDKPVEVVYLFGSQAAGNARPDSDYDFGALFLSSLSPHERFETKLEILSFLTGFLRTDRVDVLDLGPSPIRFQYEAIFPRQIIFERNAETVKDFEYNILTRYFDEMYFMKQTTRNYMCSFNL